MILVSLLFSAAPLLLLSAVFLMTWVNPAWLGTDRVSSLVLVMAMEFIVIHSSAFMGNVVLSKGEQGKKLKALLFFTGLYSLFAVSFSLTWGEWWPALMFWVLSLTRIVRVISGDVISEQERQSQQFFWGLAATLYIVLGIASVSLPVPELGMQGSYGMSGGGEWERDPHRAVAMGFCYFLLLGLAQLIYPMRQARHQPV